MLPDPPRVFLVDDDPAACVALPALAGAADLGFSLYHCAEEFLAVAQSLTQGCVLLDARLPRMSGLELQLALVASGFQLPIIVLMRHADVPTSVRVMRAGAFDFLEKPVEEALLLERVRAALDFDAQRRRADEQSRLLRSRLRRLTPREREVMELVVHGHTNKEVGRQLGISHRTVEVYRGRVLQKLQVTTLLELVAYAGACGPLGSSGPRCAAIPSIGRRQQSALPVA
jgi:FixJ family two-component response regulator